MLPIVDVLADGTYTSVLINPALRGARRERILTAARDGEALDPREGHLVRVVEYDVPDRDGNGNGTGELIALLTTITDPAGARPDELATAYHQRWEEEASNDQLKTHLRGPGQLLRSRLPDLVHQEIWAWLIVHYALAVLISRAAEAADIDPDRISFTLTLRIARRTATGTAGFSPDDWETARPSALAEITRKRNPPRRHRTCPRALKRAATTATASRNPANQPASITNGHRPSGSAPSSAKQHDQLKLRGIAPTSPAAAPKANRPENSDGASSATSPASSIAPSPASWHRQPPDRKRAHKRLTTYRSVGRGTKPGIVHTFDQHVGDYITPRARMLPANKT